MAFISLATYSIRVIYKGKKKILSRFDGETDFINIISEFTNNLKNSSITFKKRNKVLQLKRRIPENRLIYGLFTGGDYGYASQLYNINTNEPSYERKPEEAELVPYYYLISVPLDQNEGILILQRFKSLGIKSLLMNQLNVFLKQNFPLYRIEFNQLIPKYLLSEYLRVGRVSKMRFLSFNLSKDITDSYALRDAKEVKGEAELVIKSSDAKGLPIISKLKKMVTDKKELDKFVEIFNYKFDTLKVELKIGEDKKVIEFGELNKFNPYINIDNQIRKGPDDHPQLENIHSIAMKIHEGIGKQIRVDGNA